MPTRMTASVETATTGESTRFQKRPAPGCAAERSWCRRSRRQATGPAPTDRPTDLPRDIDQNVNEFTSGHSRTEKTRGFLNLEGPFEGTLRFF
jgi:hypothetical protein